MKQRLGAVTLAASLLLGIAGPALASSGFAQCGGGANGYTNTSKSGWGTHKFGTNTVSVTGPTTVNHGWFTGQQAWQAPTPGNGYCLS
jgi:hypothetical protein